MLFPCSWLLRLPYNTSTACCGCLQVTAADDDYTHNDISHEFLSTKSQTLEAIFRVFTLLLPDSLFTFSAAKYCRQGHIKPHDDRAFTQVGWVQELFVWHTEWLAVPTAC